MNFGHLRQFIASDMSMEHVYQPVMLMELLKRGGRASISEIAQAILDRDPTQLEYYSLIVKNMVGRVLTKNRGVTEKDGDTYRLIGGDQLSDAQVTELRELCQRRLEEFEKERGERIWEHRKRGHRPISGSIRFEVLRRASFRCESCGISAEEKSIEVDHIHPKSLGGKDDLSNYQALCFSCNAAKRNTDKTDFREYKTLYGHRLDLAQLWNLVADAALLACPDTSVMHMGQLAWTPTVALFGPSAAELFGPGEFLRDAPYRAVTIADFPCRDQNRLFKRDIAWIRRCQRTPDECPAPRCLHGIDVATVADAALALAR